MLFIVIPSIFVNIYSSGNKYLYTCVTIDNTHMYRVFGVCLYRYIYSHTHTKHSCTRPQVHYSAHINLLKYHVINRHPVIYRINNIELVQKQ